MKKSLFSFALAAFTLLACFGTARVSAQITGITVHDQDSLFSNSCQIPFPQFFSISGSLSGTPPVNDMVTLYVNFGDGTDTSFSVSDQQNYFYAYITHNYQIAGTFAAAITATSSNSISANTMSQTFVVSNTCASLSGMLYVDVNSNCTYDAGTDVLVEYAPVKIKNTAVNDSFYAWVDNTGSYAINLPSGYTYTVTPLTNWYYYSTNLAPSCPVSGSATVALTGTAQQANFAYSCNQPDSVDLYAEAWAENYRPAYNRTIEISAGSWWNNYVCSNLSATITLTLDPQLTYTSTNYGPAPVVSGNTLTWTMTTPGVNGNIYSQIEVMCSSTATLGDSICNTIAITSSSLPDPNPANNTYTFCAPINNSMDPNSKQVAPQGIGAQGYIANGTPLNYLVNFQNTGNDVAYNVTIKDTLNANLDINTVKINRSSAPVQVYTLAGNVLDFRFSNINLPDSTANASGSHGFVAYTVLPKNNLAAFTPITNTAHIFFDYNPAINTNTTLNTIEGPTAVQHLSNGSTKVSVYPNPANEQVFIKTDNGTLFTVSMMDMLGRTISFSQSENGNATINTQSLSSGLYLVKVIADNGKELTTKINVQH